MCQRCNFFFFFDCTMWNLLSLVRDQTQVPCSRNVESQLLDHQGSPQRYISYVPLLGRFSRGC